MMTNLQGQGTKAVIAHCRRTPPVKPPPRLLVDAEVRAALGPIVNGWPLVVHQLEPAPQPPPKPLEDVIAEAKAEVRAKAQEEANQVDELAKLSALTTVVTALTRVVPLEPEDETALSQLTMLKATADKAKNCELALEQATTPEEVEEVLRGQRSLSSQARKHNHESRVAAEANLAFNRQFAGQKAICVLARALLDLFAHREQTPDPSYASELAALAHFPDAVVEKQLLVKKAASDQEAEKVHFTDEDLILKVREPVVPRRK